MMLLKNAQPPFTPDAKDYGTKPPTTEQKVKVSLRAERRNLCPTTQIASSLIAPRNDTLIPSVPLVVQSFVSRS